MTSPVHERKPSKRYIWQEISFGNQRTSENKELILRYVFVVWVMLRDSAPSILLFFIIGKESLFCTLNIFIYLWCSNQRDSDPRIELMVRY